MSIWGKRRQAIYMSAVVVAILAIVLAIFLSIKPVPTCFDNKQNGDETGVDCGGSCARVCLVGVQPIQIAWTRVFPVSPGFFYVISQVENPNNGIGIKNLPYTIRLTDSDGLLVTTRKGETFLNPREKLIIFEGAIETGAREATRATLTFDSNNFEWRKEDTAKPEVLVEKRSFQNGDKPRLEVGVTNNSIYTLRDISVPVILSDRNGNAFAGNSTVIDRLAKNETKTVVFTWPQTFPLLPAAIDVYPRVNLFNL